MKQIKRDFIAELSWTFDNLAHILDLEKSNLKPGIISAFLGPFNQIQSLNHFFFFHVF